MKKKYKLEIVKINILRYFFTMNVCNPFIRIDGKDVDMNRENSISIELSLDELKAVWEFAVKNKDKLDRVYLEGIYKDYKFKKEFESSLKRVKGSESNIEVGK